MTDHLFGRLQVCRDVSPHSAAMNMAIDEALLEMAIVPTIRFYGWRSPALSFGYFGRFSDVAIYAAERDLVRRWTGGGKGFLRNARTSPDLIPANSSDVGEATIPFYRKNHGG